MADACDADEVTPGLFASYRKDVFFPDEVYDEYTEPSGEGGRVHVVGVAMATGTVTGLRIDGQDPEDVYVGGEGADPAFDWSHVWPKQVVAGRPVWVSFHSRRPRWDAISEASLEVQVDTGVALSGTFDVRVSPVRLTYVTTEDDGSGLIVHVQNTDSASHTLDRVHVNGVDLTDASCVASPALGPGESARLTVPLCEPALPGAVWTVALTFEDGTPPAVGGGRVVPPRFPIEAWNNTSECPWPGGDDTHAASLRSNGIDTHYLHGGVCGRCGCDSRTLLEQTYATDEGLGTLVTAELLYELAPLDDTSGIAAVSTGDESDGSYVEDDPESASFGVPVAALKAAKSRRAWDLHPELPTFNGGYTNGHIGAFAGMADIQGMDVYIGACAPHITRFGTHPTVRMPYDYLRNARDNHMPLPTWLYSQGLSPAGWKGQPVPSEILVQGMSVVAAGGKGLMWFQANQEAAAEHPDSWAAMEDVNRMVRAVRTRLRTGDLLPGATTDGDAIVDAIRSADALIVPVIALATSQAPTDLECLGRQVPHVFADQTVQVTVSVPRDLGVADVFEVRPDGLVDAADVFVREREVSLRGLALSDAVPARLFVLAASGDVRAEMAAALEAF